MAKSKLDSIVEAFDVPEDTKGEQLDDEKVEDEAQKLNEEDIKPEVKEKESEKDGDSQSDLSNVE
jgi:hypothetical protein